MLMTQTVGGLAVRGRLSMIKISSEILHFIEVSAFNPCLPLSRGHIANLAARGIRLYRAAQD